METVIGESLIQLRRVLDQHSVSGEPADLRR